MMVIEAPLWLATLVIDHARVAALVVTALFIACALTWALLVLMHYHTTGEQR